MGYQLYAKGGKDLAEHFTYEGRIGLESFFRQMPGYLQVEALELFDNMHAGKLLID